MPHHAQRRSPSVSGIVSSPGKRSGACWLCIQCCEQEPLQGAPKVGTTLMSCSKCCCTAQGALLQQAAQQHRQHGLRLRHGLQAWQQLQRKPTA